jgi:hypothetical protein
MNSSATTPDLILHHGRFTTLDRANPTASAVAIADGKFSAVGHDRDVMKLAGKETKVIDLKGRRVLPGRIAELGALAGAAGQIEWRRVERADHGGKGGHIDPFVHLSAPLEGRTKFPLMAGRNASERPEKRPLKVIIIDKSYC